CCSGCAAGDLSGLARGGDGLRISGAQCCAASSREFPDQLCDDRSHGADGLCGPASSCGWPILARTSLPAGLTQSAGETVSGFLLLHSTGSSCVDEILSWSEAPVHPRC